MISGLQFDLCINIVICIYVCMLVLFGLFLSRLFTSQSLCLSLAFFENAMMDSSKNRVMARHPLGNVNVIGKSGGIIDKGISVRLAAALGFRGPRKFGSPAVSTNRLNQLKQEVGEIKNKRWQLPKVDNVMLEQTERNDKDIRVKSSFNSNPEPPVITALADSSTAPSKPTFTDTKRDSDFRPNQFLGRGYMFYAKLSEKDAKIHHLQRDIQELEQIRHSLQAKITSLEVDLLTAQKDTQRKLEKCDYEWQKRLLRQRERLTMQHNVESTDLRKKLAAFRQSADEMRAQLEQLQKDYAIVTAEMERMSLHHRHVENHNNRNKRNNLNRADIFDRVEGVKLSGRDEVDSSKENDESIDEDDTTSLLLRNTTSVPDDEDTTNLINGIFSMGGESTTELLVRA